MHFSIKSLEYHTEIVQGPDLVSSFPDWGQTTKELIDERTKAKSKLQT